MALSATWTVIDPAAPAPSDVQDAVWSPELGIFVAVGDFNGLLDTSARSADGVTWTYHSLPVSAQWRGVVWAASLGIFVTINGTNSTTKSATSTDGATWTPSTTPFTFSASAITWSPSLGLFAACSQAASTTDRFATSPDGLEWTIRTGPNRVFQTICWSEDLSLFVAFASNASVADNIATSADGITWTARSFPEVAACTGTYGNKRVIWAADLGLFVGISTPVSTGQPTIVTSSDGTTWTFRALPNAAEVYQAQWVGLCWVNSPSGDFLAAVGLDGVGDTYSVMTSPDGVSWAWADKPLLGGAWSIPVYAPALDTLIILEYASGDEILVGTGFSYSAIYPNRGNPTGGETVTIIGDGTFGGFRNTLGQSQVVAVYFDKNIDIDNPTLDPATFQNNILGAGYWEGTDVTVTSDTTLTVVTPDGKGITTVLVYGWYNGAYRVLAHLPVANAEYTYLDPAILSVAPATGNSGTVITITSENLYRFGTQEITTNSPFHPFSDIPLNNRHRLWVVFSDLTETEIPGEDINVVSATSMTAVMPYHVLSSDALVGLRYRPADLGFKPNVEASYFQYDETTLPLIFTYVAGQWGNTNLGYYGDNSIERPNETISFPWFEFFGANYRPPFYEYVWSFVSAPLDTGWWHSINEAFSGTGLVIYNGRPKAPRGFGKLSPFAVGSAGMMGGFPGAACVLNNRLIYAENVYSDAPIIRIFNGRLDRELIRVPKTTALANPIAVVTLLAANDTVYFTTLDSGTTSANWAGRVFALDPLTATTTLLGAAFGSGQVPYALAWYMGQLWVGTNPADPAVPGNVYRFRPGIDTVWTTDEAMSAHTVAGVTSLLPFAGNLYVGTSGATGARGKILVRDTLGAYTTSDTGTGGAAAANNCYPALTEFQSNLYASYWNPDAPAISLIRKLSGTWSTVYTGTGATLKPFIAFPQDASVLLALGGGLGYDVGLARTTDGTTWVDRTAFLQQFTPTSTGLPAFGVLKR